MTVEVTEVIGKGDLVGQVNYMLINAKTAAFKVNMEYMILLYIFILIWVLPFSFGHTVDFEETLTNKCLDGIYHKDVPGPEEDLYLQCKIWKRRSCCTYDTTVRLHSPGHYNFNFNHCDRFKNMSAECRKHFVQDLCFYECTPNGGPWIVKVDMKIRKEKYQRIPLCASSCDNWFQACKNDYTCTDNWVRNLIWTNEGNKCPDQTTCQTYKDIYHTSHNFCQQVWDNSWMVVPDTQVCMKLWFNDTINPNDAVTRFYVEEMKIPTNKCNNLSIHCISMLLLLLFINF